MNNLRELIKNAKELQEVTDKAVKETLDVLSTKFKNFPFAILFCQIQINVLYSGFLIFRDRILRKFFRNILQSFIKLLHSQPVKALAKTVVIKIRDNFCAELQTVKNSPDHITVKAVSIFIFRNHRIQLRNPIAYIFDCVPLLIG